MNVLVSDIKTICDKLDFQDFCNIVYLHDIQINGNFRLHSNSKLDKSHINLLLDNGIKSIDVLYNKNLLIHLVNTFPDRYRKPVHSLSFIEIDKIMHAYKEINKKCNRERYLISSCDIANGKTNSLILEYNQRINFEKWNSIKPKVDKTMKFDLRYSERGIIVFVNLDPRLDNYNQRFFNNSHLISILVGQQEKDKTVISNDFVGTEDVIQVDKPENLLGSYIRSKCKLIIVGDELNTSYQKALAEVRDWDKYARFLVLKQIDFRNKEGLLQTIKMAYNTDNWNINDFS